LSFETSEEIFQVNSSSPFPHAGEVQGMWSLWAHCKKQEMSHQVLGGDHGPTAHEHKKAEREAAILEAPILSEGRGVSTG
jgi:hypothetical protein